MVERAVELGMDALAITDHNHLGGTMEFQATCRKNGIKPILGCELYYTKHTSLLTLPSEVRNEMAIAEAREAGVEIPAKAKVSDIKSLIAPYQYDTKQYHIILLAINQTGWQNLVKLQSESARLCTYNGRFCCDNELLSKYNEGIIMTTACVGNAASELITKNRPNEAKELILEWKAIFGDRLYLEIQPILITKQLKTNYYYSKWSRELEIPLVAATDCHYTYESDWDDHDTLLCMGMGKFKDETARMKYDNEYWLKSREEMEEGFEVQARAILNSFGEDLFNEADYIAQCNEALDNTNLIADRISDDIKLGADVPQIPNVKVPVGFTPEQWFMMSSYDGLYDYCKAHPELDVKLYEKRLAYELSVINPKGFAKYMLIVKEYVSWCIENDIPVGPSRGSAGGSLALYLNKITQCVDPIQYDLLFSRFLTPDRTALPDVDTDFSWANRERVIHHLEDEYGKDSVCHIGLWSTLGVKSGLKDVGRVLRVDFGVINNINKKIDEITLKDPNTCFKLIDDLKNSTLERDRESYKEYLALEEEHPELFRLARKFEGCQRNMGVHASGILITPVPVTDLIPVRYVDGVAVTLYTGTQLEDLNMVKFDILGLKTLDILDRTIKSIDKDMTVIDLYNIVDKHLDDPEMFQLVKSKQTDAIFQLESPLFKGLSEAFQPDSIHDITAMTATGRPGPLSAGADKEYAKNKAAGIIQEPLPGTRDIIEKTYSCILYQEQIMQIAKRVCCVDDNQADKLFRKAISKKKQELFDLCRQVFIYGKLNIQAPEGYDASNKNQVLYDPEGKQGAPIKGGMNNGYNEAELTKFFDSLQGYVSYLFNLSHSVAYSFLSTCSLYCMKYYPAKFIAAVLSMQDKQEDLDKYIKVARGKGLEVRAPHINESNTMYQEKNGDIYVGLLSIKGLGGKGIDSVIDGRPYACVQDMVDAKIKKQIGEGLIKAGALDFVNKNRHVLLNEFHEIRGDLKKKVKGEYTCFTLPEDEYGDDVCITMEKATLGSPITCIPYWDTLYEGDRVEAELILTSVKPKKQKDGRQMAFIGGTINGCQVEALAFASIYGKNAALFDMDYNKAVYVTGKKDDKGKLLINKVTKHAPEAKKSREESAVMEAMQGIVFNM
jgi:DNA polymerase-3 subunit alpha